MIRPTLNHLNLKTTRLKEMIDWYAAVTGGKIIFQSGESTKDNPIQIAFMSNDSAPSALHLCDCLGCGKTRNNSSTLVFTIWPSSTILSMI